MNSSAYIGQRVVVTGGASGIGRCVAALIRDSGGDVVVLDWKRVDLDGVTGIEVDLGDPASIDAAIAGIGDAPVHALCNVAAVSSGMGHGLVSTVAINYLGTRRLTEALVPRMARGGGIVCTSSGAARNWRDHAAHLGPIVDETDWDRALASVDASATALEPYPLSKMALNLWARRATPGLSRHFGLRMNVVAPGLIDTQQPHHSSAGDYDQLLAGFTRYVDRIGQPEEVAAAIAFLASSAASFVNGQIVEVDGGMSTIAAVEAGQPS